jgi:hypothetical protein
VAAGAVSGGIADVAKGLFEGVWSSKVAEYVFSQVFINAPINAYASLYGVRDARSYLTNFAYSTFYSLIPNPWSNK